MATPERDKSMLRTAVVNGNDTLDTRNAASDGAFAATRIPAYAVCLAPSQLALLASLLQLPVALRVDLDLPTREHVVRRHVPDRAVQPDMVIVIHIPLNQAFASSSDSGVRSRMRSRFSDLCQRSSFPFDCG